MQVFIKHPSFARWPDDRGDRLCGSGSYPSDLRTGFVCKECGRSVLAYEKPKKCEEHEEAEQCQKQS